MAQSSKHYGPVESGFGSGVGQIMSGTIAFTTTGATVKIAVPFTKIIFALAQYVTACANTDSPLSIDNAGGNGWNDGKLTPDTDGTVTLTRPAGTTSGAVVQFVIKGIGI